MKNLAYIFVSLLIFACSSDDKATEGNQKKDPANTRQEIKFPYSDVSSALKDVDLIGKVDTAVIYSDSEGDHLVVLSETGEFLSKPKDYNESRDAELYAYNFIYSKEGFQEKWKIQDFVRKCPVDIECRFLDQTFEITDLDQDNKKEIWTMYIVVCHGDVSPCQMKIIMYEGEQKYAMRGENRVMVAPGEYYGGEFKFDQAFEKGPEIFQKHAKKKWKTNIDHKWN